MQILLHTKALTQSKLLHREPLTQRSCYSQKLLHTNTFTHGCFYTQATFTHRAFTYKEFYTQRLLHAVAFTQTLPHAKLSPTEAFCYRQKLSHTYGHTFAHKRFFTYRHFYTQTLSHTGAFTRRRF